MLSRPWDTYDAYLFDIDGTLLTCTDAIHYFAFCDALTYLAGRPLNLDGVVAHGNTDNGILRDALTRAGLDEAVWRPELLGARNRMAAFVEERKEDLCATVLPGVREALAHLCDRGALLAVATGNLERIGNIKLKHCGLLDFFHCAGFSDEYERRTDIFAGTLAKVRRLLGQHCSVCVVGDTPSDIEAAHENRLEVIAVATGIYSLDELSACDPELCVASLETFLHGSSRRNTG